MIGTAKARAGRPDDDPHRGHIANPQERWFAPTKDDKWPEDILNEELHALDNPAGEFGDSVLATLNCGNVERGICALPFASKAYRQSATPPVSAGQI